MNLVPDIAVMVEKILVQRGFWVERSYVPAIDDASLDLRLLKVEQDGRVTVDDSSGNNFFVGLEGSDVNHLYVVVCPSAVETELLTRGSDQDDVGIDVAVIARVPHPDSVQEVDLLMKVPETIKGSLRGKHPIPGPSGTPHATWIGRKTATFNQKALAERGVFIHVTTHTFRVLGAEA